MIAEIPILPVLFIVFLAALTRSTFGFGDALVGMPLLAVVTSVRNATPLMGFIGPTLAVLLLLKEWRRIDVRSAWRLILSTIAGIPIGLFFLKRVDERAVNLVLAAVIILFSATNLVKPNHFNLKSERSAVLFGFAAGILGAAYNTNGPPVVFYGALRKWPPETFRATLQGYFLPTGGAILLGQGLAGLWTKPVVAIYLYALPVLLAAVAVGTKLSRVIPSGKFNRYVYGLMLILGSVLLIKAIG